MTAYLLDTSVVIDFGRGWEPTRSRLLRMMQSGETLAVCDVIIAEFFRGVHERQRARWERFFHRLTTWEVPIQVAMAAGNLAYDLARQGVTLSISDAIIAAVALDQDAIVATENPRHFPLRNLRLISLRGEDWQ